MKKLFAIILVFAFLITLSSCSTDAQTGDYFGFSKQIFPVIEEKDTHGGFHGDGSYYLILDCSNKADAAMENVGDWKQLPLSENLNLIMYGGGYNLSEEAHIPAIENGYYCFRDRHSEAKDSSDDSELFSRASFNFSLAVYDSGTNRFYYFEFDT